MMNTGDVINQHSRRQPFFVVGAHRSGTTLLRFMLGSHSRLYLPPESEFIPALFGRAPRRALGRPAARRCVRRIFRLRFAREWQGAAPELDALIPPGEPVTPARLIDAIYTAYARQHGAERWGDKTPTYTGHMDLLARIFPEARFVHLMRDGRDVALSVHETWGRRPHVDLVFAARTWRRRITEARRSAATLAEGRYLELRYEDLVADPETQLRQVCRFLDETFEPAMLEPHLTARKTISAGDFHEALRHPPDTGRVGRWRAGMSAADLRVFEAIAGTILWECGYEPASRRPPGPGERLRIVGLSAKYGVYRGARRTAEWLGLRMPN